MAEQDETEAMRSDRGTMDIGEQLRTWRLFVGFMKWHVAGLFLLLLALLLFRTNT